MRTSCGKEHSMLISVLPTSKNFGRQTQIGRKKSERANKSVAEFSTDLPNKGRKKAELFCSSHEMLDFCRNILYCSIQFFSQLCSIYCAAGIFSKVNKTSSFETLMCAAKFFASGRNFSIV
jgi:hypothetical protein